jgi:hypothetical protein
MQNFNISSGYADPSYLTNALDAASINFENVSVTYLNDYGLEISEEDIDENGEDIARSLSSIMININVNCDSKKLKTILDKLIDETECHFEIN